MVKQIAVILGAINLDNQKKILEGMEIAAREFDCNLFVFTNYVGTRETEESIMAATQVLKLPDFNNFDGVVLVPNTIHNPYALDKIMKDLNTIGKPMVSIDRKIDGMSCVAIDSYEAQYEMVEHMLYHGYTNILYVSGSLVASSEARKRSKAFQDAMMNNGMMFDEGDMYEGAFTMESGIMIGEQILAEGKHPEAIICGNDDMAHGIRDVFKKAGYKVPEDVKICGFDNGERSQLDRPSLTTVDKSQRDVGYKAILEIMELLNGKDIENYSLPCTMKYRESCGCQPEEEDILSLEDLIEQIKHKYIMQQRDTIFMSDVVRGLTADFAKASRPEQLFDILKQYVPQFGVEKFYLCACDPDQVFVLPERNLGRNIDVLHVNDNYTEYIDMAIAYEKGTFTSYKKFQKGFVLPEECRTKSGGNTYVVNQICYQNCCYGYAVCQRVDSVVASGLYYSMLMEIGVGLENVRQRMLLKDAVDRLNGMWCYDNLTMLYNRSGFSYEAKTIMDRFKEEDMNAYIIFMDADGLKTANDTLGHEVGDMMIREIGAIVHKNVSNEMLGMRYGGDEFVLFGGYKDGQGDIVDRVVQSIRDDMRETNQSGKHPFKLSASIGVSTLRAREIDSLDNVIEQADQKMYQEKRAKKLAAAEAAKKNG